MMWPRRKRKGPPPAQVEALKAKEQAERQLEQAHTQHAEALSLAEKLHQIRARNHFGQSLDRAFGGGNP